MSPSDFYKQVESYSKCIRQELINKQLLAIQLSTQREKLMLQLAVVEKELNPILDRVEILERETNRLKVFA